MLSGVFGFLSTTFSASTCVVLPATTSAVVCVQLLTRKFAILRGGCWCVILGLDCGRFACGVDE